MKVMSSAGSGLLRVLIVNVGPSLASATAPVYPDLQQEGLTDALVPKPTPRASVGESRGAASSINSPSLDTGEIDSAKSRFDEFKNKHSKLFETQRSDSLPFESQRTEGPAYERQRSDSLSFERAEALPFENQRSNEQRYDSQRYESQRYESQQFESPRFERRRYEAPRSDNQRYGSQRLDNNPRYGSQRFESPQMSPLSPQYNYEPELKPFGLSPPTSTSGSGAGSETEPLKCLWAVDIGDTQRSSLTKDLLQGIHNAETVYRRSKNSKNRWALFALLMARQLMQYGIKSDMLGLELTFEGDLCYATDPTTANRIAVNPDWANLLNQLKKDTGTEVAKGSITFYSKVFQEAGRKLASVPTCPRKLLRMAIDKVENTKVKMLCSSVDDVLSMENSVEVSNGARVGPMMATLSEALFRITRKEPIIQAARKNPAFLDAMVFFDSLQSVLELMNEAPDAGNTRWGNLARVSLVDLAEDLLDLFVYLDLDEANLSEMNAQWTNALRMIGTIAHGRQHRQYFPNLETAWAARLDRAKKGGSLVVPPAATGFLYCLERTGESFARWWRDELNMGVWPPTRVKMTDPIYTDKENDLLAEMGKLLTRYYNYTGISDKSLKTAELVRKAIVNVISWGKAHNRAIKINLMIASMRNLYDTLVYPRIQSYPRDAESKSWHKRSLAESQASVVGGHYGSLQRSRSVSSRPMTGSIQLPPPAAPRPLPPPSADGTIYQNVLTFQPVPAYDRPGSMTRAPRTTDRRSVSCAGRERTTLLKTNQPGVLEKLRQRVPFFSARQNTGMDPDSTQSTLPPAEHSTFPRLSRRPSVDVTDFESRAPRLQRADSANFSRPEADSLPRADTNYFPKQESSYSQKPNSAYDQQPESNYGRPDSRYDSNSLKRSEGKYTARIDSTSDFRTSYSDLRPLSRPSSAADLRPMSRPPSVAEIPQLSRPASADPRSSLAGYGNAEPRF